MIQKLEHQNFQLMNEICELTKKINDGNARSEDVVQSKEAEVRKTYSVFLASRKNRTRWRCLCSQSVFDTPKKSERSVEKYI